ncbi:TPA: HEPN/Toprim-associated domain-containing protein [Escherichia coli]
MGTVISLEVSGVGLDWSKNSLGIDHGGLFQSADHHVKPLNEDQIEEGEDFDTPDGILCRTVLRKPLGQVAYRLELLGFTLENIRYEYELMAKDSIEYQEEFNESCPEYAKPISNMMSFDEFVNFIKSVNISELNDDYISLKDRIKERELIMGRFNNDELLSRIPQYDNAFDNAWSEKSAFGTLVSILHPYSVMRLLAENPNNHNEFVTWDYGDLVSAGYANIKDIQVNARRRDKFLIATEGSTDSNVIKYALHLLRPDVEDFFHFIDMSEGYPFTGSGNLVKFAAGLVKIDIQNLIVFVLDNDCEGIEAYEKIRKLTLPHNISCIHLPDLPHFNQFPAIGPHGVTYENINGRAVAIECYLDLRFSDYDEAKIRWSNYKKESDAYQGALENKDYYTKKFMKLKPGSKGFSNYDFAKLAIVLDELIKACSKISSEIRKNEVDVQYPD